MRKMEMILNRPTRGKRKIEKPKEKRINGERRRMANHGLIEENICDRNLRRRKIKLNLVEKKKTLLWELPN